MCARVWTAVIPVCFHSNFLCAADPHAGKLPKPHTHTFRRKTSAGVLNDFPFYKDRDKPLHKILSLRSELGVSINCNVRWIKTGWMREMIHLKIRGAFYVHRWFDTLRHPGPMRLNSEQVQSQHRGWTAHTGLRLKRLMLHRLLKLVHGALFIANGNLIRFHYSSGLNQD